MKKIIYLVLFLTLVFCLTGCTLFTEERYGVFVTELSYKDFTEIIDIDISDGYHIKDELNEDEFLVFKQIFNPTFKFYTDYTLRTELISFGFDYDIADEVVKMIVDPEFDHCFILSRINNKVKIYFR